MAVTHTDWNLFDAPKLSGEGPWLLAHGCNCQGVWGRGIALAFKQKFPEAYADYRSHSLATGEQALRGTARIYKYEDGPNKGIWTVALYTSIGYAPPDSAERIFEATAFALEDLRDQLGKDWRDFKIFSNKFNSGLFPVPWPETQSLIQQRFEGADWTVCTPPEFNK